MMSRSQLLALTAMAFTAAPLPAAAYCSRPSAPYIPSGYLADGYQLESAKSDVEYYLSAVDDYIRCLRREADDINNEAQNVIDEWNSAVRSYNNR